LSYPDKLLVVSPHIRTVPMPFGPGSHNRRTILLEAFAALLVTRDEHGRFGIQEMYQHDETGARSVDLLIDLCGLMEDDRTALGAFRIGDLAASLVQVPLGSSDQVRGKVALLYLRDAVMRQPIDAALLDDQGGMPTLKRAALACDLMAEWDEPGAGYNPERLRRQLTARAQAIWVAIAKARLPAGDAWQAMFDFAAWKEVQLID